MSIEGILRQCVARHLTPQRLHGADSLRLACSATFREDASWALDEEVPAELRELWEVCGGARLFTDVDYGQWGLVLLGPEVSWRRTLDQLDYAPDDMRPGDVVIGEFLGDSELLIYAPSEAGDSRILVSLPLDAREDWYRVGSSLEEFLVMFVEHQGQKFWEPRAG